MSVIVASNPIHSVHRLSGPSRGVLDLIEGGHAWLEWAIHDPDARYHFEDERVMVEAIQSGLHASPLILLPRSGLLAGPARLMRLEPAELRALAHWERQKKGSALQVQVVTILNQFKTASDFAHNSSFLDERLQPPAAIFQAMSLGEQIALNALVADNKVPGDLPLQTEAARFAAAQGRSPLEFVDYYRAYLDYVTKAGLGTLSPDERAGKVQGAVDELQHLLFGALDCPRIVAPWDIGAAIAEWFMLGNRLGFSRISAGVQQIIANTDFALAADGDAALIVESYLDGAQALLRARPPGQAILEQDGASWRIDVAGEQQVAELALGADGLVTLTSYGPRTAAQRERAALQANSSSRARNKEKK